MEDEIIVSNPGTKNGFKQKIHKYRVEFDKLKRTLKKAIDNYETKVNREVILCLNDRAGMDAKLLNQQTRIMHQNDKLTNATKVLYDTDKLSVEIIVGLDQQNKRAAGTQSKIKEISGRLGESDNIISRMMKRERITKVALSGVTMLILIGVMFIIYKNLSA